MGRDYLIQKSVDIFLALSRHSPHLACRAWMVELFTICLKQLPFSVVACQVQSGPDPGILGAQARDSVCLLEIKHAVLSFTKREPVQNH